MDTFPTSLVAAKQRSFEADATCGGGRAKRDRAAGRKVRGGAEFLDQPEETDDTSQPIADERPPDAGRAMAAPRRPETAA